MAFLAGDQRYYFVPCPHCGEKQRLEFSQIKWDQEAKVGNKWDEDRVKASAHYECCKCHGAITDGHKTSMLRGGEWRPTNPAAATGRRSYHLNSLYAPWRSCSFGELAAKFLRDKGARDTLQDFQNSTMAIPWEEEASGASEEAILACRNPDYRIGQCPVEPVIVTLCADVGQSASHWSAMAWALGGEGFVLDYGTVTAPEDILHLRLVFDAPSGRKVAPMQGLIDSGFNATAVYRVCALSDGVFFPAKGSKATSGTIGASILKDYPTMPLYTVNEFFSKVALYIDKIEKRKAPFLHFPADAGDDFLNSFAGQKIITNRKTGKPEFRLVAGDHYADTVRLHYACVQELRKVGAIEFLEK